MARRRETPLTTHRADRWAGRVFQNWRMILVKGLLFYRLWIWYRWMYRPQCYEAHTRVSLHRAWYKGIGVEPILGLWAGRWRQIINRAAGKSPRDFRTSAFGVPDNRKFPLVRLKGLPYPSGKGFLETKDGRAGGLGQASAVNVNAIAEKWACNFSLQVPTEN